MQLRGNVSQKGVLGVTIALMLLALPLKSSKAQVESGLENRSNTQTEDIDARPLLQYLRDPSVSLPKSMKSALPSRALEALERKRAERHGVEPGNDRHSLKKSEPVEEAERRQDFIPNPTPTPKINIGLTGPVDGRYAGDVNGDGTSDYLFNDNLRISSVLIEIFPRDERTEALEDRVGKTAVFFGGTPSQEEDQFLYRKLEPIGDLNGDGYDDALSFKDGSADIYEGSPAGYQDSGEDLQIDLSTLLVNDIFQQRRGFTDLDGDGFEDFMVGGTLNFSGDEFAVVYGASSLSDVTVRRYDPRSDFFLEAVYNLRNLREEGDPRIVRLSGSDPVTAEVFSVNRSRDLVSDQSFPVEEMEEGAFEYETLALIDINGNGRREIFAHDRSGSAPYILHSDSDLVFDSNPDRFTISDRIIPVGDIDEDGRHDFYTGAISFGPSSISDGLSSDTDIPLAPGDDGDPVFIPAGGMGEITGDDRPDILLAVDDGPAQERGRRYASVDDSRELLLDEVRYPASDFFDGIPEIEEVGDVNGDGSEDFAAARRQLNQIDIFFGGSAISEEPDRTLRTVGDTLSPNAITGGDLNGDGHSDIIVGHSDGSRISIHLGGSSLSTFPDQTIRADNQGVEELNRPRIIGDVNEDGVADLLVSNRTSSENDQVLFFGGDPLPSNPDRVIQYGSGTANGSVTAALGDVNGDETADFAIGRPDFAHESEATGRVDVYFGDQNPTFDRPNFVIEPPSESGAVEGFGDAIAGGDFDDDGVNEIAIRPSQADTSATNPNLGISLYKGGFELDTTPDRRLQLPADELQFRDVNIDRDGDGFADQEIRGVLEAADIDVDGIEDLILATSKEGQAVNALRYEPLQSNGPVEIFRAPNQDADLGGDGQNVAVGDFLRDGIPDLVLVQRNDANDAAISARFYRFRSSLTERPPAPLNVGASSGDEGAVQLSWNQPEGSRPERYRIYRDTAPIEGTPSDREPLDSLDASTTSYADEPEPGQTYHYAVTSVDTEGNESSFSSKASAFLYPSEVTASASRTFGGATDSTGYRLVALPGRADTSIADAVSGKAGSEWQAYYDDGSDSDFLVKYDGSDAFTFQAGNGFWLTATSEWTFDGSAPTVELRGDSAAAIGLREGWNVISNPLGKDVSWASVEAATGADLQPIWAFGGAFDSTDTFASAASGTAYYFYNGESSRDSLVIPYPGAPGGKAAPMAEEEAPPMLAVSASAEGGGPASTVKVGLSEEETRSESIVAPPGRFEAVSLRIEASGADSKRRGLLMAERRTAEGEGQTFRVRLTNEVDGPVALSAENLDAVEGQSVALLHPSAGRTYDLREQPTVEIEPGGEATELKLAVGTEGYVKDQKEQVLPKEISLTSYPNPIRQQGTLEYALPEASEVTLRVYDVLGREVATLEQGRKEAGRHTVRLETSQLSSGVYFGRLEAGEQTLTQKITVVR